jgi:3-dehydroquinate synthetase
MVIAAKASNTLGWSNENCTDAIINANRNNNLPVECGFAPADLADAALSDKKRAGAFITAVLVQEIGKCTLFKMSTDDFCKAVEKLV